MPGSACSTFYAIASLNRHLHLGGRSRKCRLGSISYDNIMVADEVGDGMMFRCKRPMVRTCVRQVQLLRLAIWYALSCKPISGREQAGTSPALFLFSSRRPRSQVAAAAIKQGVKSNYNISLTQALVSPYASPASILPEVDIVGSSSASNYPDQ